MLTATRASGTENCTPYMKASALTYNEGGKRHFPMDAGYQKPFSASPPLPPAPECPEIAFIGAVFDFSKNFPGFKPRLRSVNAN